MTCETLLRPSEKDWQGALDNLCNRFSHLDAATIADTLRKEGGHAGRTAKALRALPAPAPSAPAAPAPAVAPAPAAVEKPVAAKPAPVAVVETTAVVAEAVRTQANAIEEKENMTEEQVNQQPVPIVEAKEAPPPPDSKLLFVAALQGDVQHLSHLIEQRADLNVRYTGRPNREKADKIIDATPLHLVVTMGSASVAEVLLRHGADVEAKMRRALGSGKPPEEQYAEMTALHLAAMEGHTNIVEMLLAHGADKEAMMLLTEHKGNVDSDRAITPLEIAQEMASKGHSRDSVISILRK